MITEAEYFSKENEKIYCGSTQYRNFFGTVGLPGCEARAMAELNGEWKEETSNAFLIGNYVDAHFSGTLATFKAQHPEIFKKDGSLKAEFERANVMIARCEQDEYFMKTLSGGMQEIQTIEMFGIKWKTKMDSYHKGIAIVDLKTTASIRKRHWAKDLGKISFIEYWGYDIQLALYQEVDYRINGKRLPVLIAAVSKEPTPDIEIIGIDQNRLDECIKQIERNAPRLIALKKGEIVPDRCEQCDYCTSTKKLSKPIHYNEIPEPIN